MSIKKKNKILKTIKKMNKIKNYKIKIKIYNLNLILIKQLTNIFKIKQMEAYKLQIQINQAQIHKAVKNKKMKVEKHVLLNLNF